MHRSIKTVYDISGKRKVVEVGGTEPLELSRFIEQFYSSQLFNLGLRIGLHQRTQSMVFGGSRCL